jgi:glycosyltransferase involved in cell wall biosynthesis
VPCRCAQVCEGLKLSAETAESGHVSRYLAIVPAYNEAAIIARTVQEIHRCAPEFDVLVVDDGSSDRTAANAASASARVLRLPFNVGIGGAMQSGYIYALERGYEVAVQIDGDGQHDPRYVRDLLAALRGRPVCNLVTGSRFLNRERAGHRSSAPRRAGIGLFARVISAVTGQHVTDPTSGFRMTDRAAIELFASDYPHDYPEVEAILLMHTHRLRSCEIPVRMRPRTTGVSSIAATRPLYYMVKVLLAIFVSLCRARPASGPREPKPLVAGGEPS